MLKDETLLDHVSREFVALTDEIIKRDTNV